MNSVCTHEVRRRRAGDIRRPKVVIARATIAWISASTVASAFWNTARPPFSWQSRTVASPPSTLKSATTTAALSPANRIAVLRPIPLAAPAMMQLFHRVCP